MPVQRLGIVIPAYNPGSRLAPLLETLCAQWDHVWVVDDGSTDGSIAALKHYPVQFIRFPQNRGKGHALLAGFQAALAEESIHAICTIDADGQHDPLDLPELWRAFHANQPDLLLGSRTCTAPEVPWRSRLGNRMSAYFTTRLTGRALNDTQCGFRILSRRFAQEVLNTIPGGRYETETAILFKALNESWACSTSPIHTRYEAGNPTSHFRPLRDSLRVLYTLWRRSKKRQRP